MGSQSVGLIGLGRFGRMVYDYLKPCGGLRVWTRDSGKLSGFAEAATFEDTASADVVVLAVAISAMDETCRRLAPILRRDQIVIDTCSVKVEPVRLMLDLLPAGVEILGTHPLFGPDSGEQGIAGLKIVLCPVRIGAPSYRSIRAWLESLGLALIEATPEEHDRQVARTQAVFHLLAQAFHRLGWGEDQIATPGPEAFFRLTRTLQSDSFQLFSDMQRRNPFTGEYRRHFLAALAQLDQELGSQPPTPPQP
jgi:prephenate dehydrogenase